MSNLYQVTAVIGSPNERSRTQAVVKAILAALNDQVEIQVKLVELAHIGSQIGAVTSRDGLSGEALAAVSAIESADLVVAASPVYKGSYTGLFKHLIDFIHPDALVDRPVLIAATGGGDKHALVVEHQLRPLFGFFRAQTVATAIYASEAELQGYVISSSALQIRINEAASQAAGLLRARAPRS